MTTITPSRRRSPWLFFVGAVVMLAGLLFGYDQGVIGGALHGIEDTFHPSTLVVEIITSWVTLGALVGALVAGSMTERIGRRWSIIWAAILFTIGALVEALAPNTGVMIVGRLVVGFGVGVASMAAPLYAAEMAPARLRGRFVSMYQLAITFGILIADIVDQVLSSGSQWRLMLGLSVLPSILLVLAMFPLPDSATWYLKAGRRDDAAGALRKVRPGEDVQADLDGIAASLGESQATWREVFAARWRAPLVVGIGLAVFQQLTGVNAVIYYSDKIFAAAGFSTPAQQTAATTWSIGVVNVVATFIAIAFVDRLGRRPLLFAGLIGMGLALLVMAACFRYLEQPTTATSPPSHSPSDAGVILLVAMVVFIASFAFSLGPVVWTVINEIYPAAVRGRGVAIATAANWGAAWLVTRFFLTLVDAIGQSATFVLFAVVCAITYVFVWRRLPETRGRTLEQIQQMWVDREPAKAR
ncbi:MFS transporter [Catellatospora sp. IY07-71]|uniref:sugar porter family MFS transporter n=1 Tax=Catellatospora sp. IY07-71 TaxID=2728827 RepID=UPI001BB43BFB|nr:sugar porter family MFS transporter [Catellatospora sp. IY07-71]BCJ75449.1 MFS transporter [Catellatospora sp. IY07-71]